MSLGRIRLEYSRPCEVFLKRVGLKSVAFTDENKFIHLFDYFDCISEVESLSETSNSIVFPDSDMSLSLDTFSDLQQHFLSLRLAFPEARFDRYLRLDLENRSVELVIRASEKSPASKILRNLLFGLRCAIPDLSPQLKFLMLENFQEISDQFSDQFSDQTRLPSNFQAFNRPVLSKEEISDLPGKLLRDFGQEGGLHQPKIPYRKFLDEEQLELWRLVEAEKTAMHEQEWLSRMHRVRNLEVFIKRTSETDSAMIIDRIKRFIIESVPRHEVDIKYREDDRFQLAIESWERRLQEAESQAEIRVLQERVKREQEMSKIQSDLDMYRSELKDERNKREHLEHEYSKLVDLLQRIRDGQAGNFAIKRGTRKFDV